MKLGLKTIGWIGIVSGLLGHVFYQAFPIPSLIGWLAGFVVFRSGEKVVGGLSLWFATVAAAEAIFLKMTIK